jgi:hypothetical protein
MYYVHTVAADGGADRNLLRIWAGRIGSALGESGAFDPTAALASVQVQDEVGRANKGGIVQEIIHSLQ